MSGWHDDDALMETFRTEVGERLASLSRGLLALEANPSDPEALAAIFRDAHTIKGSARMMGFVAVKEVAHRVEDILGDLKDGRIRMSQDVADVMLACADLIPALIAPEGMGDALPPLAADMVGRLEAARTGAGRASELQWHPVAAESGSRSPSLAAANAQGSSPSRPRGLTSAEAPPRAAQARAESAPPPPPERVADHDSPGATTNIRLDAAKVYELIDLVGEATVAHVRSTQTARSMSALLNSLEKRLRRVADPEEARQTLMAAIGEVGDLLGVVEDALSSEARGLERLQEQAMRLAMLPTASIFAPYPRVVRDLCRDLGKEVDLHLDGGDTELDKQVLEGIVDPLRHLLVNAVDHGIESPEERLAAGKPQRGSVTLQARQQGRQVVIEVADDGRGIDVARVREAAARRGLISAEEDLSDPEVLAILFQPGFSTTRLVTDLSGRGVGLDVVKTATDALKGSVEIIAEPGKGTRFLVTLPITLAIVEGVMVTCGGQTFAVPVSAVEEVVSVAPDELSRTSGRDTAVLRGRTTSVVPLHLVLGLPPDEEPWGPVLVITTSTRRVGFRVGAVQGQSEVVIKGLGSFLPRTRHVAGATINPDGSVMLVLDPFELVDAARRVQGGSDTSALPEQETASTRRLLAVDDSLAIREMARSILQGAGYAVEVAVDGAEALEKLAGANFDAVVTDIEMPRMNGFDLTARIRAEPALAHLPVIVLTSLVREEDRRRGLAVGADAYLTKSGFDQTVLLEVIEGLVRAGGRTS